MDEAKLAGSKVVLRRPHGRPEGATENWPMLVEVAGAVFKIKYRARLVVSELLEENRSFVIFIEDAAMQIAREPWIESSERVGDSFTDSCSALGVGLGKGFDAFAETRCVFVSDGEDADAALGATRLADEMCAATSISVCDGCVCDLDQSCQVFKILFAVLGDPRRRLRLVVIFEVNTKFFRPAITPHWTIFRGIGIGSCVRWVGLSLCECHKSISANRKECENLIDRICIETRGMEQHDMRNFPTEDLLMQMSVVVDFSCRVVQVRRTKTCGCICIASR